jgi:hypothetical protein
VPLVAVAVGTAIDEAVVVTLLVAYQILLTGFAAKLGLRVVVVLIGTAVVGAVVISVLVSVLITEFVVLVEIRRRLLARGTFFLVVLFFLRVFFLALALAVMAADGWGRPIGSGIIADEERAMIRLMMVTWIICFI